MKAHRAGKVIKITTFQSVKRGNWLLRFSCTDMGSIMLLASSVSNPENVFIKYFSDEDVAIAFVEFLVQQAFYVVDAQDGDVSC